VKTDRDDYVDDEINPVWHDGQHILRIVQRRMDYPVKILVGSRVLQYSDVRQFIYHLPFLWRQNTMDFSRLLGTSTQ